MDEKVILKNLTEQKLKAFAVGNMGKHNLSKKELEELRKKEQEEATAHVFQEFFNTFQDPAASSSKVWVKAGTYDAGSRKEDTKDKGKLYKPQSKISSNISENLTSAEKAQEYARLLAGDVKPERLGKKKEKDKKKSNLELFKEELRQIQEEREERHKYKGLVKALPDIDSDSSLKPEMGSFDNGDPNTTNLYLGNLNPKITEAQLMEIFGRYGPLASIKIMWPRSDEEKARGRNCGFVAFMNRKDGERALRNLNGKDILSYEMKLGWGKSVPIPPHPIYIPPALLNLSMPPPPSGLPFNAQPQEPLSDEALDTNDSHLLEKILHDSIVKVVTPTDRNLVALIHRMIEFVIREGPLFEAVIMNREINNPMFRFLFENQSPAHVYYRWKLYSMMQGDSTREWQTSDFRMFKGGSIWRPPPMNIYTQGMPEDLIVEDDEKEPCKGALSVAQRDRLEELLRYITPERKKIAEAMVFCIEHADAADEISECILEALSNISTDIRKKIARLYLISDILHNCSVKVNNASHYRRTIEKRLIDIMKQLHLAYNSIESRLTAEGFRVRVQQVFIAWEDWLIYPREFIFRLQGVFNGNEADNNENIVDTSAVSSETENKGTASTDGESDGIPLDEDVEGDDAKVWDGATLKGFLNRRNSNSNIMADIKVDERIDGAPLSPSEDPDGMPLTPPPPCLSKDEDKQSSTFIPSKWETVDPEQVEAQAMTTSKWDQLESIAKQEDKRSRDDDSDESSGELQSPSNKSGNTQTSSDKKTSEERRRRLREVELKAMTYQDELESGHRTLKSGWTVAQQVEHYRRKLIRKVDRKLEAETRDSLSSDVNGSNTVHDSRSSRYGGSSDKSDQSNRRKISPPEENDSYSSRGSRKYKRRSCSSSPSPSPPKVRHRPRSRTPISAKRSRTNRARSGTRSRSRSRSRSVDGVPLSPPTPPRIVRRSVSPPPRRSARYSPNSRSPSPRSPSPRSRHRRRVASPPTPPTPPRSSKHRARSPHDEKSSSRKYKHSRY